MTKDVIYALSNILQKLLKQNMISTRRFILAFYYYTYSFNNIHFIDFRQLEYLVNKFNLS